MLVKWIKRATGAKKAWQEMEEAIEAQKKCVGVVREALADRELTPTEIRSCAKSIEKAAIETEQAYRAVRRLY